MQRRTIAVKVTGGDMVMLHIVMLHITDEDAQRVILDVAVVLALETRHVSSSAAAWGA